MGKRKRIPVAAHAELTEYAALLRALRTTETSDLTSHILSEEYDYQEDLANVPDNVVPMAPLEDAGATPHHATPSIPHSATSPSVCRSSRWTRWPLLVGDVYVPEFSFEDEVRSVAFDAISPKIRASDDDDKISPINNAHDGAAQGTRSLSPEGDLLIDRSSWTSRDSSLSADDLLPPHLLRPLCDDTAQHLSEILGAVAGMLPDVHISMQDKLKPVDWADLLEVVRDCGLVSQPALDRVRSRMLALYTTGETLEETHDSNSSESVTLHEVSCSAERRNSDLSFLQPDWYDPKSVSSAESKARSRKGKRAQPQPSQHVHVENGVENRSSSPSEPLAGSH